MKKILEHFEAMNFNKLLIELKDLASNAEQEAILQNIHTCDQTTTLSKTQK